MNVNSTLILTMNLKQTQEMTPDVWSIGRSGKEVKQKRLDLDLKMNYSYIFIFRI